MGYNIDNVKILTGEIQITPARLLRFLTEHAQDLPGSMPKDGRGMLDGFRLTSIPWYGEGSGNAYELLQEFLGLCDGDATILITWEGGDSFSGLVLQDGKVLKGKVTQAVVPEGEST